jgi:hypothetical protein
VSVLAGAKKSQSPSDRFSLTLLEVSPAQKAVKDLTEMKGKRFRENEWSGHKFVAFLKAVFIMPARYAHNYQRYRHALLRKKAHGDPHGRMPVLRPHQQPPIV